MFEIRKADTITYVTVLESRLDILIARSVLEKIQKIIDETPQEIHLDVSQLTFIDSAILGVFVRLHQNAKSAAKKLVFINVSQFIEELFRHTHMDRMLHIQ